MTTLPQPWTYTSSSKKSPRLMWTRVTLTVMSSPRWEEDTVMNRPRGVGPIRVPVEEPAGTDALNDSECTTEIL